MRLHWLHHHEMVFEYFNITFILHLNFYRNLANGISLQEAFNFHVMLTLHACGAGRGFITLFAGLPSWMRVYHFNCGFIIPLRSYQHKKRLQSIKPEPFSLFI